MTTLANKCKVCGRFGYVVWRRAAQHDERGHTIRQLSTERSLLLTRTPLYYNQQRFFVGAILSRVTRIRYIVLGTAGAGGVTLAQYYENFKDGLPDFSWTREFIPDRDVMRNFTQRLREKASSFELPSFHVEVDKSALNHLSERTWERLKSLQPAASSGRTAATLLPNAAAEPSTTSSSQLTPDTTSASTKVQAQIMEIQTRYQKEVERLEQENRELRRDMMLARERKRGKQRVMKRSLIEMYSDVLDDLLEFDTQFKVADHLPRVVVVGDQSSGKTSVLEMIAGARLFPRGSGEMMTRSPVKVTLSEGPYHVASFKGSSTEFDLTKESDLESLRREIEKRMKSLTSDRRATVSSECISLNVKGPGLQRMVLVDLPGIISTVTRGMSEDTATAIRAMARHYMGNPNAIILCIQDGSLDAERSNVTELVTSIDPHGKRTIFVLTKVDLAETSLLNPDRIKQILEGRLFPMQALGYFAVVTGKGNAKLSIPEIVDHEQKFFQSSRLFTEGYLKPGQMTTRNLSLAVSERFWAMVRESIEQQADSFKAMRFNLETEWRNTFPQLRQLDREELFDKARSEILDDVISLSTISPREWEESFMSDIWEEVSASVFEDIFLPSSQGDTPGDFNTMVDIKLKRWAEKELPVKSVKVGCSSLQRKLSAIMKTNASKRDPLFNPLRAAVTEESVSRHAWDSKADEALRVIQRVALEDSLIQTKQQWDSAIVFMKKVLKNLQNDTEIKLKEMTGPGSREQWMYWRSRTSEQQNNSACKDELNKILSSTPLHKASLTGDEVTQVRKNLEQRNVEMDAAAVRTLWKTMYRRHFMKRSIDEAETCSRSFYHYLNGLNADTSCDGVVLFYRVQKMLSATANALRQQVTNNETRRLEKNMKEVLEEVGDDPEKLRQLLTGRRVQLAEELKRVRVTQEKLEEFVTALEKEK